MKNRTPIHAADLYVLLQRELRRRQPAKCTSCFMQLPYRVDRGDDDVPNWEVSAPVPPCDHGCASIVEELAYEFGQQYDLAAEAPNRVN